PQAAVAYFALAVTAIALQGYYICGGGIASSESTTIMMHQKKLCVSKATLTSSLFTITYYFPKIDKSF
ncbi:MAG: hypothetical protein IJN96_04880, partial [Clostridia bacterium]|nr:hypothetical protein [Clostridia bacterium]